MISISWCKRQKKGIKVIMPSKDLSRNYINLAKRSLVTMNREKSKNILFSVSAGYYAMYYSLYSVMMKLGIKCDFHECSVRFMKIFLGDFYLKKNLNQIKLSFELKNSTQSSIDKKISKKEIDNLVKDANDFVERSKKVLSLLNEDKISEIRKKLRK